ncbi:hypothetical protein [Lacipirellula sp.]|uniref:hypothetical protein n=1 Tax=Lacipirellula sp. TaxID=2691419 RepID=UPI003D150CBC
MSLLVDFVARTLQTAVPATAATTAAVAACGALENDSSAAPINAVSHIAWGDEAAEHDELSAKYTLTGAALNAVAITSWAAVYELGFGRAARRGNVSRALLGGVATAAAAYVVDYYVVPRRLTPGFEKRLTPPSMVAAYAALAASLPLASLLHSKRR